MGLGYKEIPVIRKLYFIEISYILTLSYGVVKNLGLGTNILKITDKFESGGLF